MSAATLGQLGALLGGVGLFMLGMWLLTEGLRMAAGATLRGSLGRATHSRQRALLSGIALTAVVQPSRAVTVAAIGFVNAGVLTLRQVLWVLFGSNLGTTLSGWLVALVGLQLNIDLMALPLIGLGMTLRLASGAARAGQLGLALAGMGVMFLGIATLRDGFGGLVPELQFSPAGGVSGVVRHVLLGAALTLLLQSSGAAAALVLTAVQGGVLGLEPAAAVVIGANIGSMGAAVLAAVGATAHARRVAAAHLLFKLLVAGAALLMLPWLVALTAWVGIALTGVAGTPLVLALFQTLFNLLGVLLMWPLSDRLAGFLMQRFRRRDEEDASPRYLDAATSAVPALAVEALSREVGRFGALALSAVRLALPVQGLAAAGPEVGAIGPADVPAALARAQTSLVSLDAAIDAFVLQLHRASLTQYSTQRLAGVLRRAACYSKIVETLPAIAAGRWPGLGPAWDQLPDQALAEETRAMRRHGSLLLQLVDPAQARPMPSHARASLLRWEQQYRQNKGKWLLAGALGTMPQPLMDASLRANSALRRAVQQAVMAGLAGRDDKAAGSDRQGQASPDD